MLISDVLRSKPTGVVTVSPVAAVAELVALLAEHKVGALVVSEAGTDIVGIVSERDVARQLAVRGVDLLSDTVRDIMTATVITCCPQDTVEALAGEMTERKIRHLPVVEDGELVGIVSIGDIVKARMSQLADERDHLIGYVQQ